MTKSKRYKIGRRYHKTKNYKVNTDDTAGKLFLEPPYYIAFISVALKKGIKIVSDRSNVFIRETTTT